MHVNSVVFLASHSKIGSHPASNDIPESASKYKYNLEIDLPVRDLEGPIPHKSAPTGDSSVNQ